LPIIAQGFPYMIQLLGWQKYLEISYMSTLRWVEREVLSFFSFCCPWSCWWAWWRKKQFYRV
jgi:hypothetical protein